MKSIVTLREPSLGPVFGMKGGATGGGASQVVPADEIDLHFTGDIHAVTTANNLLAAMIDNHIQQGNRLGIDTRRIAWRRVIDMNDRALREIVIGLGGRQNGFAREDAFNISVASEVMAVLCLAEDFQDLKDRLARMVVGYTAKSKPITAADLKAVGSMALLLKDAIKPNLVQTSEGTPAIIHGGPFANIAHGTNSIQAMRLAQALSQVTVTEAGFASELGGEKFLDFVSRTGKFNVDAVVLVTTLRALKYHGGAGKDDLAEKNLEALVKGFDNLDKHIENMQAFGVPLVVAVNYFPDNDDEELELTVKHVSARKARAFVSDPFNQGSEGCLDLARAVEAATRAAPGCAPIYEPEWSITKKIETIASEHVRRRPHQLHPPGAQGHRAAQRAGLRQAARDHRQDAQLAVRRSQGAGPAARISTSTSTASSSPPAPASWWPSAARSCSCPACPRTPPPRASTSTPTATSAGCSEIFLPEVLFDLQRDPLGRGGFHMKKPLFFVTFFALAVVWGGAAELRLASPNGGEQVCLGRPFRITWTATNVIARVKLQLIRSGGGAGGLDRRQPRCRCPGL